MNFDDDINRDLTGVVELVIMWAALAGYLR